MRITELNGRNWKIRQPRRTSGFLMYNIQLHNTIENEMCQHLLVRSSEAKNEKNRVIVFYNINSPMADIHKDAHTHTHICNAYMHRQTMSMRAGNLFQFTVAETATHFKHTKSLLYAFLFCYSILFRFFHSESYNKIIIHGREFSMREKKNTSTGTIDMINLWHYQCGHDSVWRAYYCNIIF